MGTVHCAGPAGRNTAVWWALKCRALMTRLSVRPERCRVLVYQVIRLTERLLKGFSTLVLAPRVKKSGMRNRIPHFPQRWISWENALYNGGCDGSGCCCFFASQGLSLCCGRWSRQDCAVGLTTNSFKHCAYLWDWHGCHVCLINKMIFTHVLHAYSIFKI